MKKALLLCSAMLISLLSLSQDFMDVIYLKDGTVIKGKIIQKDTVNNYIIKTFNGQLYSCINTEIEQVLKEQNLDLEKYGGSFSYGISIGGGGIVGFPIRFHGGEKFAFEMGLHYRPAIIQVTQYWDYTSTYLKHAGVFTLGANYYMGKYYKGRKQKVKLNGIKIMAGAGTGQYNSFLFGIGWIHESFKKYRNNKSFTFELGPGYAYTDYFKYNMYHNESYSGGNIAIYWKVQWNCFKY